MALRPEGFDNKTPKDQQAKLEGLGRRANAAHNNSFEGFAPFAAAVVIAHLAHADAKWSAIFAIAFVVLRAVYVAAYLSNQSTLRSTVWILGVGATSALMLLGAFT
jgi:uncharacterized MAPEG superfamily protein